MQPAEKSKEVKGTENLLGYSCEYGTLDCATLSVVKMHCQSSYLKEISLLLLIVTRARFWGVYHARMRS